MTPVANARGPAGYVRRLSSVVAGSLAQLLRPASHTRRAIAARRLARHGAWLTAGGLAVIAVLMFAVDVPVIRLMPQRGAAELWPVRVLTDFGKSGYVLEAIGAAWLIVVAGGAAARGRRRLQFAALDVRFAFIFLAVALPNLVGEGIKGVIGRGRPFVGGEANAFNFVPLAFREPFASLPSAHAITAVALAVAVASVWPRTRLLMAVYALAIVASRVVLLAHHPSDVIAGALLGALGALLVRQWFAVRRLGFAIDASGRVEPRPGPFA